MTKWQCDTLLAMSSGEGKFGSGVLTSPFLKDKSPLLLRMITNAGFYFRRLAQHAYSLRHHPAPDSSSLRLFNERSDRAREQLTLRSKFVPFTNDVPTVVCLARNEEYRIAAFIQHYLSLGARSIHIVDNQSEDGTAAIAARSPCVTVWNAAGSYRHAEHGSLWRGALSRRYGLDKWVLNLDADEFIAYSNMEQKGLLELQRWLTARGKSCLAMPVVDMYPDVLNEHCKARVSTSLQNLIDESPYFDRPIKELGSTCWLQNSHRGLELKGGVRLRMMHDIFVNESPWVNVFPLLKWSEQTAYYTGSRHSAFPCHSNSEMFFAALLHFKFVGNFQRKILEAIKDNQYWDNSKEYKRYAQWMACERGRILFNKKYSVRFLGNESLITEGLIQPINWSVESSPVQGPEGSR